MVERARADVLERASSVGGNSHRKLLGVVVRPHPKGEPHLLQVANAINSSTFVAARESWKQEAYRHYKHRENDDQLQNCERPESNAEPRHFHSFKESPHAP